MAVTDRLQQTATYIACFDAETGARRWVRYLGAASSEADNFMGMGFGPPVATDYGHRLLSLDGPYLYYQTNLGAVISLEAGHRSRALGGDLSPTGYGTNGRF